MTKKENIILNIVALISLMIFGYLLFFTVYHQMVIQNEGFFYVLVFGGILILAFVLLSLMTKLLAISRESADSFIWIIMEGLFILVMSYLFIRLRITMETSIPAEESVYYNTAVLMERGTLTVGGIDLLPDILSNPAIFYYGLLTSLVFKVTGVGAVVIVTMNSVLLLMSALLVYLIARKCGDKISGLIAFTVTLFMPALGFSVYNFNAEFFYAWILLLSILFTIIPVYQAKTNAGTVLSVIFAGIFWGLCLSIEPVGVLMLVLLLAFRYHRRNDMKYILILALLAILISFGFSYLESVYLETAYSDVFSGVLARFSPTLTDTGESLSLRDVFLNFNDRIDAQQKPLTDHSYFLSKMGADAYTSLQMAWLQLGNQLLYMFMLVLSIACAFYMIRSKHPRVIPILSCIMGAFLMTFLSSNTELNQCYFLILLIISGSVSLTYMYDNHHALADKNLGDLLEEAPIAPEPEHIETEEEKAAFLLRAQALIFIGANDAYYQQLKEEERNRHKTTEDSTKETPAKPTFLESPLPMPKKHVPRELDFDEDLSDDADADFDFDFDFNDEDS